MDWYADYTYIVFSALIALSFSRKKQIQSKLIFKYQKTYLSSRFALFVSCIIALSSITDGQFAGLLQNIDIEKMTLFLFMVLDFLFSLFFPPQNPEHMIPWYYRDGTVPIDAEEK